MAIGTGLALLAGSAVSAVAQGSAAKKAAKAQSQSADQATQLQREMFEQISENYAPFLKAGSKGMAAYLYEMGLGPRPRMGGTMPKIVAVDGGYKAGGQTFKTLAEAEKFQQANKKVGKAYKGYSQSPMAEHLLQEGTDAIEGGAAASGGLFSGATLQALEDNRRQVIQADTADYFSRLLGLTNMGMSAAGNQASAGQNYANNAGNLAMQAGNAKAQGYMDVGNAMSGFLGDAAGIYGYFNNPMQAYASPTMGSSPMPKSNPFY